MPTQQPTEQEMRDYLATQGISNKQKQLGQLRRVYNSIHQQVERGLTPSLAQAYGKEKQFYHYVPRRGKHAAMFAAIITIQQLRQLVNRSTMQNFTFRVFGIAIKYEARVRPDRDWSKPTWLSAGPTSREFVEYAMNEADNLTDFINEISGEKQQWLEVLEITVLDTRSIRP